MVVGFAVLLVLFASGIMGGFDDQATLLGWRLMLAGGATMLVQSQLAVDERRFVSSRLCPFGFAVALPIVWIVLQVTPLRFAANPVWDSAGTALGGTVARHLSIDVGASVLSVCWLTFVSAMVCLSASLGIDRTRAEQMLVAVTIIALGVSFVGFVTASQVRNAAVPATGQVSLASAAIASLLSCACGILAFERYETRYRHRRGGLAILGLAEGLAVSAFLFSNYIVFKAGDLGVDLAASGGLVVLLVIVLVRRFSLGLWIGGALAILFGLTVLAIVSAAPSGPVAIGPAAGPDPILSPQSRLAADAPWGGTGAGTSAAILPLYESLSDPAKGSRRAADILKIEVGMPVFWVVAAMAVLLGLKLLVSAVKRGRDSVYAAAGAAVILAIVGLGFTSVGLFNPAVAIMGSAALGLALAQSESRNVS